MYVCIEIYQHVSAHVTSTGLQTQQTLTGAAVPQSCPHTTAGLRVSVRMFLVFHKCLPAQAENQLAIPSQAGLSARHPGHVQGVAAPCDAQDLNKFAQRPPARGGPTSRATSTRRACCTLLEMAPVTAALKSDNARSKHQCFTRV